MPSLPRAPLCVLLAGLLMLAGCGRSQDKAYAKGWNAGYEEGLADGRTEGQRRAEVGHQGKWGLIGLALGGVLGAALVILVTRKHLASQWRRRRRRRELERMVGTCKADLDPELHAQVLGIAKQKAALEERLAEDEGPLIAALHDRIRPELVRLDTRLLEIAALLQQLRDLRRDILPGNAPGDRAGTSGPPALAGESDEAEALRTLKEQRRIELSKNVANIARCESQLAGLATFLDELHMRLGNLKTIEQADAFDRFEKDVGEEIDALGSAFETTLSTLAREG